MTNVKKHRTYLNGCPVPSLSKLLSVEFGRLIVLRSRIKAHIIMNDLIRLMEPAYIEVWGKFLPRGGISIDPFVNGGTGAKYRKLAESRFADWKGVRG